MNQNIRILAFCLIGTIGIMAMAFSAFSEPRTYPHYDMHQVHIVVPAAFLQVEAPSVPQTKVYSIKKYFGMTVGSDISHCYSLAKITFRNLPFGLHLPIPPLIHFL